MIRNRPAKLRSARMTMLLTAIFFLTPSAMLAQSLSVK
jgi:hypothetical protein